MSLIEREKLIELAYSRIDGIDRLYGQTTPDASDLEYAIDNVPTVDAVPVVHGEWVEMERGHYFKCSLCRNPIPYKFGWKYYNGIISNKRYYNYCPNCGAKMDGGGKDDRKRKTD